MSRYFSPISIEEFEVKLKAIPSEDGNPFVDEENRYSIRSLSPKIESDLKKCDFNCENVIWDQDELLGYHILSNGLTYLGIKAGGDWEQPVFFILYWSGKDIRAYIPSCKGNPWNHTTKQAYGNNEEKDTADMFKQGFIGADDLPDNDLEFDYKDIVQDIIERIQVNPSEGK